MRIGSLLLLAHLLLLLPGERNASRRHALPAPSRLVKEAIVNVFRLRSSTRTPDEVQLAVQPLLFVLAQNEDADTGKVLSDLTSYDLGEANDEIFRCILTRRGIADPAFVSTLARAGVNDCQAQLGKNSAVCVANADRERYVKRVRASIVAKDSCDIEY
jgi:hypothetical protein